MESELDEFNDETFGEAEIGDWELEHEKFVMEYDADKLPPSPCEIPKIWETADLSDFWSAGDLDVSQPYDSVLNLEESVDKLVREDELEDPAILNISKYGPGAVARQAIPVAPAINPNDIWGTGLPQNNLHNDQANNHDFPKFDPLLDLLSQQLRSDLTVSGGWKVVQGQTLEPPVKKSLDFKLSRHPEYYNKEVRSNLSAPNVSIQPPPPKKVQPLLGMTMLPPEQVQNLLLSSKGTVPPQQHFFPKMPPQRLQSTQPRSGLLVVPPGPSMSYSRFSAPPPPLLSSLTPLTSSSQLQKPFPVSPKVPFLPPMQQPQQLQPQHQFFPQFLRPPPLDPPRLSDILSARIEAEQPEKASFDPRFGSWMSPQDQLLVLNCQLRSLNVGNPYVEDYYFAVKFLRLMTKLREAKLAETGLPSRVPPPYASIPAPVTSMQLLSPEHPHRIALRCRFIINLHRRYFHSYGVKNPVGEAPSGQLTAAAVLPQPLTPVTTASATQVSEAGPYSTQLGRPTKSNINAQRIIADLSVATALDEEQKKHFKTEAEEVASILKVANKIPTKKTSEESSSRSAHHQAVVDQRRRLAVLARIERLYATVLNIDETNVSLARIFVRNDESRHLMGHRLNLLKVLHRDLFIAKHSPPDLPISAVGNNGSSDTASAISFTRHLAVEIFEVPKGVRLFPLILRFLFPEDRQFCVAEFISNFARISGSIKSGIDTYAQMLYAPCRDTIYKGAETSPTFISSCLQLPLSNSATALSWDALIEGELEPNVVAMFSSRLGVSLFLCLLDACARNSQRDDPILFCELFVYACRIVGEREQEQQKGELPTPLERFTHFAQLDPRFLMPLRLAEAYERKALVRFGTALRQLAIRLHPINSTTAPTTLPQLTRPQPVPAPEASPWHDLTNCEAFTGDQSVAHCRRLRVNLFYLMFACPPEPLVVAPALTF
ncbi:hypothetical protein TcWFU_008130 [Taenia crassiceps]|uniref:Uncharacterized protein n=1 Tax=Taenia crassiceps TaxID=6207 RepID=A0ABR4Q9W5_9CEST